MDEVIRLRWSTFAGERGGPYHLARVALAPGRSRRLHCHDFAELFFVEDGAGLHHVNGTRQKLARGDLVFVRPDDRHGFEPARGGLVFTNLATPAATVAALGARYLAPDDPDWPWAPGALPRHVRLGLRGLERAADWARRLAGGRPSALLLDAFLLDLAASREGVRDTLPDWLAQNVDRFETGRFTGGAGQFARMAGRSAEHVNRTIRRITGRTTTDYLNDLRIAHAARLLRLTDTAIETIAYECGLANPSYFYRLFALRMGRSPAAYRKSQRMGVD